MTIEERLTRIEKIAAATAINLAVLVDHLNGTSDISKKDFMELVGHVCDTSEVILDQIKADELKVKVTTNRKKK